MRLAPGRQAGRRGRARGCAKARAGSPLAHRGARTRAFLPPGGRALPSATRVGASAADPPAPPSSSPRKPAAGESDVREAAASSSSASWREALPRLGAGAASPGRRRERSPREPAFHGALRCKPARSSGRSRIAQTSSPILCLSTREKIPPGSAGLDSGQGSSLRRLLPRFLGCKPHCPQLDFLLSRQRIGLQVLRVLWRSWHSDLLLSRPAWGWTVKGRHAKPESGTP